VSVIRVQPQVSIQRGAGERGGLKDDCKMDLLWGRFQRACTPHPEVLYLGDRTPEPAVSFAPVRWVMPRENKFGGEARLLAVDGSVRVRSAVCSCRLAWLTAGYPFRATWYALCEGLPPRKGRPFGGDLNCDLRWESYGAVCTSFPLWMSDGVVSPKLFTTPLQIQ
jgi:hypothetical protein